MRHNDNHIQLVATLVRQDRGTAWAWQDKRKSQQACRGLEERYGLCRVAPPGAGSRRWPRPAELNKATGLDSGKATRAARVAAPREQLRQKVRAVAAGATGEADFFTRLARSGVLVKLRHGTRNPAEVTGYAVAL